MADRILLEIVTPERLLYSKETDVVVAPGSLGQFSVLSGHTPFFTSLKVGELYFTDDSTTYHLALHGGFLEVQDNHVRVLAENAEFADDIDIERAQKAHEKAQLKVNELGDKLSVDDHEFKVSMAALERSVIRIQVAGKTGSE